MNNELEMARKKVVVASFNAPFRISAGGTEGNRENTSA
jgi:hypothetical protein